MASSSAGLSLDSLPSPAFWAIASYLDPFAACSLQRACAAAASAARESDVGAWRPHALRELPAALLAAGSTRG